MNDGRMRRYFHSEAKYFAQERRSYISLSSSIVKKESRVDSKERLLLVYCPAVARMAVNGEASEASGVHRAKRDR